ncbi:MAG: SUMF1/EgtB/PvdO family nonheme iron enzyme [Myxococcaceae bacterium]|nr:SUMF1/EgtB/PvdO family nonheme iron enzyme [Myxococcaceae bacterium]
MRWLALLTFLSMPALAQWPSIDAPLPKQGGGEKDAALLISISDYAFLPDVPGAKENAAAWYRHLTTTRGVPATQVTWLQDTDATLEGVQDALAELPKKVKPGGTLWVLYIGHGAPSQDGSDGVLVGADAQNVVRSLYARSLPRQKLLDALSAGPHARVVVVLDACFSGQSGSGQQLATGTMPTLPEKESLGKAKKPLVLLTAGTSRQFAGALPNLERPAFSYLALGALRGWADDDGDGAVTASEVVTFTNAVMSTTLRGRQQTPQLNPPAAKDTVLAKAAKGERLDLSQVVVALQTGGASAPRRTPEVEPAGTPIAPRAPVGDRQAGDSVSDQRTGIVWRWMPGGRFTFGCSRDKPACTPEEPVLSARSVSGFWIAETETTGEQFERCALARGCDSSVGSRDSPEKRCNFKTERFDHPTNCVTQSDAQAFCRWAGGRLPTSEEFEYAARSGKAVFYPWGFDEPDGTRANYGDQSFARALKPATRASLLADGLLNPTSNDGFVATAPVRSFPRGRTEWGLFDMSGNVAEWTSDTVGELTVFRGGHYQYPPQWIHAWQTDGMPPTEWQPMVGFRCVRDP